MGVSENGKSSHKENDSGCLNVTAAAARKRKKGERISRKIGKNQARERGKKIERRGKKAERIAEKRVGSREKEVVGRVARAK